MEDLHIHNFGPFGDWIKVLCHEARKTTYGYPGSENKSYELCSLMKSELGGIESAALDQSLHSPVKMLFAVAESHSRNLGRVAHQDLA